MEHTSRLLLIALLAVSLGATNLRSAEPNFSIRIKPDQRIIRAGSGLNVEVIVKNISSHPIWIDPNLQPNLMTGISIEVVDASATSAPKTNLYKIASGEEAPPIVRHPAENGRPAWTETELFFGGGPSVQLQPGEVFKGQITVTKLFDLNKPGKYTIRLKKLYYDEARAKNGIPGAVNSNKVTVKITPAL